MKENDFSPINNALFKNRIKPKSLLIALSGGIDSAVAAIILQSAGIKLTAVTFQVLNNNSYVTKKDSYFEEDVISAAKGIAEKLSIPHYVLSLSEFFRENILRHCWEEYKTGRTPNPCMLCNKYIKFGKLLEFAYEIGCDGMATGHHVRITVSSGGALELERGKDPNKDQSYFLAFLNSQQLSSVFFPIGYIEDKNIVRKIASDFQLSDISRNESQDICISNTENNASEVLREIFNEPALCGNFVTENGKVLGRHKGIHNYTIGQRKGLNIAIGKRAYVKKIRPTTNEVVITDDPGELNALSFSVSDINWIEPYYKKLTNFQCEVQTRYRQKPVKCMVKNILATHSVSYNKKTRFEVSLIAPIRAVTSGQAAVFYTGNKVIAAGWID